MLLVYSPDAEREMTPVSRPDYPIPVVALQRDAPPSGDDERNHRPDEDGRSGDLDQRV